MIEPRDADRYQREIRAMIKAAGDDPEAFAVIVDILEGAIETLPDAATALRAQGFSWANIGQALRITRTAAHKRYGDHRAKG